MTYRGQFLLVIWVFRITSKSLELGFKTGHGLEDLLQTGFLALDLSRQFLNWIDVQIVRENKLFRAGDPKEDEQQEDRWQTDSHDSASTNV